VVHGRYYAGWPRFETAGSLIIVSNPAKISPTLASLFPSPALVAEMRVSGDPALLLPAERQHVGKAVAKRIGEYTAGRLCARRIFQEFGLADIAIRAGTSREPLWPDSLVGSITHTTGFCAAVIAYKSNLAGVGLDSEVAGSVKPQLFPSICTSAEIDWIRTLPLAQQSNAATLLFSAKEAFYKCQFPLVREQLGFHDATIEVPSWGEARGVIKIHATRAIAFTRVANRPVLANFLFHEQFVTVAVALPAEHRAAP
jgi:4'-phosphopantetheinyl transferase EntD